jgi:hypothetical protein
MLLSGTIWAGAASCAEELPRSPACRTALQALERAEDAIADAAAAASAPRADAERQRAVAARLQPLRQRVADACLGGLTTSPHMDRARAAAGAGASAPCANAGTDTGAAAAVAARRSAGHHQQLQCRHLPGQRWLDADPRRPPPRRAARHLHGAGRLPALPLNR